MTSSLVSRHLAATAAILLSTLFAMSSVTSSVVTSCPSLCRCKMTPDGRPAVDCSGRQIPDLDLVINELHPDTAILDLRRNHLTVVRSQSFVKVHNISVLLLDYNRITDIEHGSFWKMARLRRLSLTNNRLTSIRAESFSQLSGDEATCLASSRLPGNDSSKSVCSIDLMYNDISIIERYAFAWIQRLQVLIGQGLVPLTINAYAFYGARSMPQFKVSGVPSLTFKPRVFTNTETVDTVQVSETTLEGLEQFVFEGLRDVQTITFSNVTINDQVHSHAFSGIHFRKSAGAQSTTLTDTAAAADTSRPSAARYKPASFSSSSAAANALRTARYAQSGGLVEFIECHLLTLQSDSFRDANIAHIAFRRSIVDLLVPQAFRGVSGLQTLTLANCHLGPHLATDSLASLRGLRRLHLVDNDFRIIDPFAFRDVTDVDSFLLRFRSGDEVTLMADSFAHVTDIKDLELLGGGGGGGSTVDSTASLTTTLTVEVGAFRNLVDVERMRVSDFWLPTLRRHSFGGLTRISNLTIANCGVTDVEHETFFDPVLSRYLAGGGSIGRFDMSVGNQLRCDLCSNQGPAASVAALYRELEQTFTYYHVTCRSDSSPGEATSYWDIRQVEAQRQLHVCSGGVATWRVSTYYWTLLVTSLHVLFAVVNGAGR